MALFCLLENVTGAPVNIVTQKTEHQHQFWLNYPSIIV